jgi:BirA family biotin operon repressor/biotin-[acetyl-CoA-carboxylase] ligase
VNLVAAPETAQLEPGAVAPATLRAAGVDSDPEAFLPPLAQAFARYESQMQAFGFEPIRHAWLGHAAKLGEIITARTTRETYVGSFRDVDDMGQLVLETPKGRVAIPAADVYF